MQATLGMSSSLRTLVIKSSTAAATTTTPAVTPAQVAPVSRAAAAGPTADSRDEAMTARELRKYAPDFPVLEVTSERLDQPAVNPAVAAQSFLGSSYAVPRCLLSDAELAVHRARLTMPPRESAYTSKAQLAADTLVLLDEKSDKHYVLFPPIYGLTAFGDVPERQVLCSLGLPLPDEAQFTGTLMEGKYPQREACEAIRLQTLAVFRPGASPTMRGGVLVLPCGYGKTACFVYLFAAVFRRRALVLVHTEVILTQICDSLRRFCPGVRVGVLQQDRMELDPDKYDVTVAMIQSLVSKKERGDVSRAKLRDYGVCFIDEAHHIVATTFSTVLDLVPCALRIGLTATPYRKDGRFAAITYTLGPILYRARRPPGHAMYFHFRLHDTGLVEHRLRQYKKKRTSDGEDDGLGAGGGGGSEDAKSDLVRIQTDVVQHVARNSLIVQCLLDVVQGRVADADAPGALPVVRLPLLITERVTHLDILCRLIRRAYAHEHAVRNAAPRLVWCALDDLFYFGVPHALAHADGRNLDERSDEWLFANAYVSVAFFKGGMLPEQRERAKSCTIILAIKNLALEALDIPNRNVEFLATALSDPEQVAGRILRGLHTAGVPWFFDFSEPEVGILKGMSMSRMHFFKEEGYTFRVSDVSFAADRDQHGGVQMPLVDYGQASQRYDCDDVESRTSDLVVDVKERAVAQRKQDRSDAVAASGAALQVQRRARKSPTAADAAAASKHKSTKRRYAASTSVSNKTPAEVTASDAAAARPIKRRKRAAAAKTGADDDDLHVGGGTSFDFESALAKRYPVV